MYYSASNFDITVNGNSFIVSEMELTANAELNTVFEVNRKENNRFAPRGLTQKATLSYVLTGRDFLKPFVSDETDYFSGNFGGLTFKTGYLTDYSIDGTPNSPIQVKASILIVDKITGDFSPSLNRFTNEVPVLNFADIRITSDSTFETISNISSFTYSYSNQVNPIYDITYETGVSDIYPTRVAFGAQALNIDIVTDNTAFDLTYQGKTGVGCFIQFTHPSLPELNESLICSGILNSKKLSASVGDYVKKTISIQSTDLSLPFSITSISPATGIPGKTFIVNGENLSDIYNINFNSPFADVTDFYFRDNNTLAGILPDDALSGLATFYSPKQDVKFFYPITYPDIIVDSFAPITGAPFIANSNFIVITGKNFYSIDKVYFGDYESPRFLVNHNNTSIQAYVPLGVKNDYIKVLSSNRNKSGVSTDKFITYPAIYTINPTSGKVGDVIHLTGENFDLIKDIKFRFPFRAVTGVFTVNSPQSIDLTIPSGNIDGRIYVTNTYGMYGYSPQNFEKYMLVSGVNPTGAASGTYILISGLDFDSNSMYYRGLADDGSFLYGVRFNNEIMDFKRLSNRLLSGSVTGGDVNGPISILGIDGAKTYPTDFSFQLYNAPLPTEIFNTSSSIDVRRHQTITYSGKYITTRAEGTYLNFVNQIRFTGFSETSDGKSFTLDSNYFSGTSDGKYIYITGYPTRFLETGSYHVEFLSPYGSGRLDNRFQLLPPNNLAPFGVATQSSNYSTRGVWNAHVANDRNFTGIKDNFGISLTSLELNPWWELDWTNTFSNINRVVISNRRDANASDLTNFWIFFYDKDRNTVFKSGFYTDGIGYPNFVEDIWIPNPVSGRYFRLAISGANPVQLGLSEIEIY